MRVISTYNQASPSSLTPCSWLDCPRPTLSSTWMSVLLLPLLFFPPELQRTVPGCSVRDTPASRASSHTDCCQECSNFTVFFLLYLLLTHLTRASQCFMETFSVGLKILMGKVLTLCQVKTTLLPVLVSKLLYILGKSC